MAWYGLSDMAKKLDQLIDQNPTLYQLLSFPDFIQQLKAYNPKLLDYLTNTPSITGQLISYLSTGPIQSDSQQRKYRLPLLSIQMIQSQSICILNNLLKLDSTHNQPYLISFLKQLLNNQNKNTQLLPILTGYFLRTNICLLNNKYKEVIDCMYHNVDNFKLLLDNSHNVSITNTLQVYLNLDLTKNTQIIPDRLNIKLNIINQMLNFIQNCVEQSKLPLNQQQDYVNAMKVDNLSNVIIQLLEKYYLIADGKQMIDQILLNDSYISLIFKCMAKSTKSESNHQIQMSLLNILISILKYYNFSSYNSTDPSTQISKKTQLLLQSQPTITKLYQNYHLFIQQLLNCQSLSLYHLKIIQLLNVGVALNSGRMFQAIKKYGYVEILLQLMFRFQNCNILANMIQKLFIIVFRTQRLLNQQIKHFIFTQANIIDLTAARYLAIYPHDQQLSATMSNHYRRKPYFGHLMKIMKIYSGIQTTDEEIVNAIKSRSEIWNKISRFILKPYETTNFKELGKYENIPQNSPTQYTVHQIYNSNCRMSPKKQIDNTMIEQINRQEIEKNKKSLQTSLEFKIESQNLLPTNIHPIEKSLSSDQLFNSPMQNNNQKFPTTKLQQKSSFDSQNDSLNDSQNENNLTNLTLNNKRSSGYSDFMQRQKVKVEIQIKKQRSRSKQRGLSKQGKTTIRSPSPAAKRNKWQTPPSQSQPPKQKVSLTRPQSKILPRIPNHKKGLNVSSNQANVVKQQKQQKQDNLNKSMELENKQNQNGDSQKFSKSMGNFDQLKKIKILYQIQAPKKSQYRRINEEDKAVFDLLGIAYQ